MAPQPDPRALIRYAVAMSLAGIVTVVLLYEIRQVLLLLYVSTLLAIGFSPAVQWLERRREAGRRRRRMPRWAAILILYAGGLGVIALILWIVIPPFVSQARQLWTEMPGYLDQAQTRLRELGVMSGEWTWSEVIARVEGSGIGLSGVMNAAQNAIGAIAAVVTVLLLPLYLLVEAESLQRTFLRVFPADRRPAIARMTGDVTLKVGAWLGGQLLLAVIIGTTATIGLWIIGVPFFYVFGLIAALGEFIPVVGPIIAAVPAVLMGWTDSPTTALVVVAFFSGQQFVENNILVPRVMESQVGVSAVTVLIALLIGSALLGILGAVLAVPTAAIAQVLFQELVGSEPPRNRKGGAK